MSKRLLLDSGPLGMIAHPKANNDINHWFQVMLSRGVEFCIPEICDYELRRELLHRRLIKSVQRLDELKNYATYLPISTAAMLMAATFWAASRKQGRLAADPKELNGDVILAAQAVEADGIVVTDNVGHLNLFVDAKRWTDI